MSTENRLTNSRLFAKMYYIANDNSIHECVTDDPDEIAQFERVSQLALDDGVIKYYKVFKGVSHPSEPESKPNWVVQWAHRLLFNNKA